MVSGKHGANLLLLGAQGGRGNAGQRAPRQRPDEYPPQEEGEQNRQNQSIGCLRRPQNSV